jgi:hypothetical protein
MKIYIVIVEDHHVDTDVHPFTNIDKAIEFAKKRATENSRGDGFTVGSLDKSMTEDGWVYLCTYNYEDHVLVVERELNE